MFCTLHNVSIKGLRVSVPANEIRLEDELAYYGGSAKKVARLKNTLGMDRRRICPPDVTASDLCAHAATDLLAAVPVSKNSIDALVFVSQWPDWHQPATACELQHRIGLPTTCAAFDVNQGCAGYVYGLWLGASLIASAAARNVLLLVGDAHPFGRDERNRIIAPVFGDGGSATFLARDETAPPMYFDLGTDGSGFESIIVPAGKARIPIVRGTASNFDLLEDNIDPQGNPWQLVDTWMDGGAVFNFTMDVVPSHILSLLKYAHATPESIDWLILHQANRQIVQGIAEKSGFPIEKAPTDAFSLYGNLASASVASALATTCGNGSAALGNVLMCGYGIGLAWASCICEIRQWDCRSPLDFEPASNRVTRQQRIARWQKIMRGEISRHDEC